MHDKTNPHLQRVLNLTGAAAAESDGDEDSGLPSLEGAAYSAHARPSNKSVTALHVVTAAGDVRSFQYVHLDSSSEFSGDRIVVKFMGMEPIRVVIEGKHLWRLYDYIHQHRMPWIRVAAREFAEEGQTIVSKVTYAILRDDETQG